MLSTACKPVEEGFVEHVRRLDLRRMANQMCVWDMRRCTAMRSTKTPNGVRPKWGSK
jgi:hypothetical protein